MTTTLDGRRGTITGGIELVRLALCDTCDDGAP